MNITELYHIFHFNWFSTSQENTIFNCENHFTTEWGKKNKVSQLDF
jgi:hypothetical protein